jgi:Arm DNA-binding domain
MAANRARLTEDAVKHAAPLAAVQFLRDDKLTGFALRITPGGAKSFVVEKRVKGRVRRFTIGPANSFLSTTPARGHRRCSRACTKARTPNASGELSASARHA